MQTEKRTIANDILFAEVTRELEAGKKVTIPVKGNSMYPFILDGRDTVVLEKADAYSTGDIVLFDIDGRYILHRLVCIEDGIATMAGDGNLGTIERCPAGNIHGKAVSILKNSVSGASGRKRSIVPSSRNELRKVALWNSLKPFRRIILGVLRRIPGSGLRRY